MTRNYFIIFFLVSFSKFLVSADQFCGDWETFRDEKCFKVHTEIGNYEKAKSICKESNASLITIKSAEEQRYLEYLIFKSDKKTVNPVWLGLKFNDLKNKFLWDDNSEVKYVNWAPGQPKLNDTKNLACVEMKVDGDNLGKWANKNCDRSFGVVCEKIQEWTLDKMRKYIVLLAQENNEMRKNLKSTKEELKQTSTDFKQTSTKLTTELNKLKQNPVPIGFIYVQLPQQPEPAALWPNTFWNETSDKFAGLFFRVSGGGSAKFGDIQEDFSPRIVYAKTWWHDECDNDKDRVIYDDNILNRPKAGLGIEMRKTKFIETGLWRKVQDWKCRKMLEFELMNGEVRPRNTAVRIWKRIE